MWDWAVLIAYLGFTTWLGVRLGRGQKDAKDYFVAGGSIPVATVEVPLLGPIPMPLALLAASVLISAFLGWLLGLHAGRVGRRVARRLGQRTETAVREAIVAQAVAGLDRVERARRDVAAALRTAALPG